MSDISRSKVLYKSCLKYLFIPLKQQIDPKLSFGGFLRVNGYIYITIIGANLFYFKIKNSIEV